MKNLIKSIIGTALLLALSFSILSAESNKSSVNNSESNDLYCITCKYDQCHATAKSTGNRCKHCVSKQGDTFCWQH